MEEQIIAAEALHDESSPTRPNDLCCEVTVTFNQIKN